MSFLRPTTPPEARLTHPLPPPRAPDRDDRGPNPRIPQPREAKALGRKARGFDQSVWEAERFGIVVRGNVLKFGQHPDLLELLLATGDHVLVEASPTDRIWGIGLPADDPRAANPKTWRGLNLLGFALMQARTQLAT